MKRFAAKVLGWALNHAYRRACGRGRDGVLFLSRQSDSLSRDFALLADGFRMRGWTVRCRIETMPSGLLARVRYVGHMLDDARALARCRLCFVEGYNLSLSMLELDGERLEGPCVNTLAPTRPLVMQIWHAGGLFKQFGYKALDMPDGRSSEDARLFHMHRNYSWIVCSGEGARKGFAQALGYPVDRVVALGHPSFDALAHPDEAALGRVREERPELFGESAKPIVLLAPTLHRDTGARSFDELCAALQDSVRAQRYAFVWSYHPVSKDEAASHLSTADYMRVADIVVTDYSSVVFDASVLGLPIAFYVPDLESYSAGGRLAVDPGEVSPQLCLRTPGELLDFLDRVFCGADRAPHGYSFDQQRAFIGDRLSASSPGATQRICDFAIERCQLP